MIFQYSRRHLVRLSQLLVGWVTVALIFSSCASHKDLTILRDASLKGQLASRALPYSNYKIKVHDNLFVSIVSSNREMNEIYNPATVGTSSGGSSNNPWATLSGQFVYGYIIDKDGNVNLPGIGKVHVLGMTLEESEKEIALKANQYLKDVTAKVRLLNYKVTVIGEVNSPGVYYNYNPEFTVFDAISMANGVRNTAAINKALVLREIGDQTQTYRLDLQSISTLNSEGFNLLPNDVVVVQPAKYKNVELKLPIYAVTLSAITTFLLILEFISP